MRAWAFRLAAGAVLLTIVGGVVASFGWATGGTPELVAMGLPAWAAVTGFMAIMCFAIGAPAAGLVFCACLAGAAIGAEMLVDGRRPYSAALGATAGTVIGGLLGLLIRRRVDPCLPGVMRGMAIVLGVGGSSSWAGPAPPSKGTPADRRSSEGCATSTRSSRWP